MNVSSSIQKKPFIEASLALLLLVVLIYASYVTVGIFLGVFAFAVIFAVSFYPLFEKMAAFMGNRRKLTAFIMGLLLVALVALPFVFIINQLVDGLHNLQGKIAEIKQGHVPPLPENLAGIPYVGNKLTALWAALEKNPEATIRSYEPQIRNVVQHLLSAGGGVIASGLELVLGIIIAMIMLTVGDKVIDPLRLVLQRLVGKEEGLRLVDAMGRAIKGVAVGVMGTGFIAAVAAYIGYAITPLSIAAGLAAIVFFLVVIQLGPTLVWIPVTIWFASQGQTGWAIYSGIFGMGVLTVIDNVLKPILIARSGKLPVLVLFLGVVGGMAAWGFTGMFKGAIMLSVFYTLFNGWFHLAKNNEPEQAEA